MVTLEAARVKRAVAELGEPRERSLSYLDVMGTHPEWLGAPSMKKVEHLRDVSATSSSG